MSSRALRRLQKDIIPLPGDNSDIKDNDVAEDDTFMQSALHNKKKIFAANPFDLLENSNPDEEINGCNDECTDQTPPVSNNEEEEKPQRKKVSLQKKKKKKKPKNLRLIKENKSDYTETMIEDEIDASLREVNAILGNITNGITECTKQQSALSANCRSLLNVEHRNLNPDNEMKRIFGSRVIQSEQPHKRAKRGRSTTWMATPKDTWPMYSKTSLTMSVLETAPDGNWQMFTFEHGPPYQQLQLAFYDAVMSVNSENIVRLLHDNPYHIDCLLQLSEICKNGEDMQMAKELVERALYSFEMSFHPLFSLTKGNCRLDFRRMENRSFYTALFRHITYLGNKGCNRTALEFCKLLLSLDSESDPLCVLLMIDYYALRAEEFSFLIRLFEEWEPHRNLLQLPNFAFSYPLALYQLAMQKEKSTELSDEKLQKSLRLFPGILLPLLDKCSVHPDSSVTACTLFSQADISMPGGLRQLIGLYVGRSWPCWKEPHVISWLERNVHVVIEKAVSESDVDLEYYKRCNMRYRGTPRNISRHILLSEIKEAMTDLPPDVTNSVILSHDILPPEDNIETYSRPTQRPRRVESSSSVANFFRSLLPNFSIDEPIPEEMGAAGGNRGLHLTQSIETLLDAMRDLMGNIQPVPPPVENPQPGADNQEHNEEEWN
ncbi:Transcription factor 25 [Acanthosepion pharaonis]|uniref:Transcription factor 25 n=1 Tax=Acanthosepion pharaonis TaxID=158019 RepID=A0A812E4I6_ACAPH|nr:Transcription factor 25 [Sepia pharaonis]